ncbi:MAG: DUF1641 domain-containing protein [Burkholderiales bacterium]|nr:DUF1641 domain-containing protein [Burkholderiales bacterium]
MDDAQAMELERIVAAARDSLTDEMVGRLSATAAEGLDLLDKVNRSGVAGALPAISQLVANGDLERLVQLARTYGAAQDSLTDEMVSRLAGTVAESLSMMDRLNRAGLDRLVGSIERLSDVLERTLRALETANRTMAGEPAATGGFGGVWALMRQPENQETLRFLLAFGRAFRKG